MLSLAPFVLKLRLSLDQQRQRRLACSEYRCDGMRCVCAEPISLCKMHVMESNPNLWDWYTSYGTR